MKDRLTKTSDKGGLAFTFGLDITCSLSEIRKIQQLGERLKEYEDLEEQGLLLRLPCKTGDTVYWLDAQNRINSGSIICIYIEDGLEGVRAELPYCTINFNTDTVYLTREEAEKALAEMKGEEDD